MKRVISGIMFTLLLISMSVLMFNVPPVRASYMIFIRPDGSADPSSVPIECNGNVYSFTDNIYDCHGIRVQKNDVIVDGNGYTLDGIGELRGFDLEALNTTVRNVVITQFEYGVYLSSVNGYTIVANTITNNLGDGIFMYFSDNNLICDNIITNNGRRGINLGENCEGNIIIRNTIKNNEGSGLVIFYNSGNTIYHNNIIDNNFNVVFYGETANAWDNGYPSGGNYWSDFVGSDNFSGPYQNETGHDGIVDTSRMFNEQNRDNYPLTHPYSSICNLDTNLTYLTVQSAINAPETLDGHTIFVRAGTYYENVIVDKSVPLIGIFGPGLVSFNVVADNVYIKGFCFSSPWGFPYGRAIVLNGVSGCEISNVIVSNIDESSGIVLTDASNNVIANSRVWGLPWGGGIVFERSSNNTIFGNTIEAYYGPSIYLGDSSDSKFFHNQFYVYEARQVEVIGRSKNVWDDGYPSGGNYWSDYTGIDLCSGPYQNETNSDGIGDSPYIIDANNTDHYPLMKPYAGPHDIGITSFNTSKTIVGQGYSTLINISVKIINYGEQSEIFNVTTKVNETAIQTQTVTLNNRNSTTIIFIWNTTGFAEGNYTISIYAEPVPDETDTTDNLYADCWIVVTIPGDVNGDGIVELKDFFELSKAFGSKPGDPNWNPNADVATWPDGDGIIELKDFFVLSQHFGEHYP